MLFRSLKHAPKRAQNKATEIIPSAIFLTLPPLFVKLLINPSRNNGIPFGLVKNKNPVENVTKLQPDAISKANNHPKGITEMLIPKTVPKSVGAVRAAFCLIEYAEVRILTDNNAQKKKFSPRLTIFPFDGWALRRLVILDGSI